MRNWLRAARLNRSGRRPRDLALIWVIDAGKFEWQAVLLLISILERFAPEERPALHAYLPADAADAVSPDVLDFHRRNGVTVQVLPPMADALDPDYRHGHKILACAMPRRVDATMFLDTDTVILRRCDPLSVLEKVDLAAMPSHHTPWAPHQSARWRDLYRQAGWDWDAAALLQGAHPHFNAGVILFREGPIIGRRRFGEAWRDTARQIDALDGLEERRPWLDQIALGALAAQLDPDRIAPLDAGWNYPITQVDEEIPVTARIIHHHSGSRPLRLIRAIGHVPLTQMLRGHPPYEDIEKFRGLVEESFTRFHVPAYKAERRHGRIARRGEAE
ncbi:hypothetical protein [Roseobacter sp. HKCCA0434]|uniref:hypothetical protein n=1 Tax=Roseobacter sp. HKCCA0434 TaxID=3079297 RepID=UPI002905F23D|nr:hypothetical protein [Roseobacter sp. HKCCA0434]